MLKARTPLLVGLLVIMAVAAFVYVFGSLKQGFDPDELNTYYAQFEDASGLAPDSRIVLAGIDVGKIGAPTLDPRDGTKARVPLYVRKDVIIKEGLFDPAKNTWVNGAAVVRRQASLIGDYDVVLTPGVDGPVIPSGGEIHNVVSESGLSAVMKTFENSSKEIFPRFEKITKDISDITGALRETIADPDGRAAIKQISEDVMKVTENTREVTREVREFLNASVYPRGEEIRQIMANLERASSRLADATGPTVQRLDRILERVDRVASSIEQFVNVQTAATPDGEKATVQQTLNLLQGSVENIRKVTAKLEEGKGTIGRLLTDDKLVQDIERIVSDVEDFTSTFSRTEIKVWYTSDYYVGRDAFKTTVDFALVPSPDKYYLFQLVDDPIGKPRRITRVTQTNDPRLPPVLIEEITETTSDFKISAQFAKRWSFLTFRVGITESTGGFGVDADLMEDALSFKLDLWDFGRDTMPRLRLLARWEFMSHFFLSAGIDDILNGHARDWFFGAGFTFSDRDLKGILPLAPSP